MKPSNNEINHEDVKMQFQIGITTQLKIPSGELNIGAIEPKIKMMYILFTKLNIWTLIRV